MTSEDVKRVGKKTFLYVCDEFPYVGKAETKFGYRFNNYESKHGAFRNGYWKTLRNFFTLIIGLMATMKLKIEIS